MNKKFYFLLAAMTFIFCIQLSAQNELRPYAHFAAIGATSQPAFWQNMNKYGAYPEGNGAVLNIGVFGKACMDRKINIRYGISASGIGAENDQRVIINELYSIFNFKTLYLKLGMFNRPFEYNGLSATNGDILWSNNTRALPGYSFESDVIRLTRSNLLGFQFRFGDYMTIDDRFTDKALLHNTALFLNFNISKKFDFNGGLEIYAMWGGKSALGKQPQSLKDYIKMLVGHSGGDGATVSDQINVLGDQRGRVKLEMNGHSSKMDYTFYYNSIFDDRSGMTLHNFPDGLYGFYVRERSDEKKWVKGGLVEFQATADQSGPSHNDFRQLPDGTWERIPGSTAGGVDNYFNNGEYRSGWTYYGRCIGSPFFLTNNMDEVAKGNGIAFFNNAFYAGYLALNGYLFKKFEYKFRASYAVNKGTLIENRDYTFTQDPSKKQVSLGLDVNIPTKLKKLSFGGGIYADFGKQFKNTGGLTFSATWH